MNIEAIKDFLININNRFGEFEGMMPTFFRIVFRIVIAIAWFNIISGLIKAIIVNRASWKAKPDSELMYSFSNGSGQFQRGRIYKDAHKYLFDKKQSYISFACLAYLLGNFEDNSKTLIFLGSVAYVPLMILGLAEMLFRAILGVVFYLVINIAYFSFLLALQILSLIITPIFNIIDKSSWETQHCPNDYATFRLPMFECPHCGKKHAKLYPGICGILWAKCSCGHFIPCASISNRKQLNSFCPKCGHALAGANIRSLTLQIIGGNSTGKTAYIAAFQHLYRSAPVSADIRLSPLDEFNTLENMYLTGHTEKSSQNEVHAYYLLHNNEGVSDDGIVIYDIPDEIILSEQYERNPLNFGYSDGIIIVVDPLSVYSVRKECEKSQEANIINGYSDDSAEDIIVHFINKYSEVVGRLAKKMSKTPVAVIIAKSDITSIKRKIGTVKIKSEYNADPTKFQSLEDARNTICRKYLSDIGLTNALNNLDSVFANVAYFPVSAIGHTEKDNTKFDPQGVIEPILWIARESGSKFYHVIEKVQEETK